DTPGRLDYGGTLRLGFEHARHPSDLGGGGMTTRLRWWIVPLVGLLLAAPVGAGAFDLLRNEEATIADIHAALSARTLTCRGLVQMYLDRIEAYDKKGPALNAIVVTNPDALKVADALDAKFAQSGPAAPLHCVPRVRTGTYTQTQT